MTALAGCWPRPAQATYDLFHPLAARDGTVGSGLVRLHGSVHWPLGRLARPAQPVA